MSMLAKITSELVGASRSARLAREWNKQVAEGTFITDSARLLKFKQKIRLIDPSATFMVNGNVKLVTHSLCGRAVTMKEPYNTAHFSRHINVCKTSGHGISRFLIQKKQITAPLQSLPCPGLSGSQHKRIPIYLRRSSATGGGATSRTIIAQELYDGSQYRELTKVQKANVRHLQALQLRWINDHNEECVMSTKCLGMITAKAGTDEADPCVECVALLRLGILRNALRRPVPDTKNLKYTPKEHLSTLLGKLYSAHRGLDEIMESPVRTSLIPSHSTLSSHKTG